MQPLRRVHAAAPIRICDNGGWTDTWVARYGKVFNLAVTPLVSAEIEVFARGSREAPIIIRAENYGTRYAPAIDAEEWGPHPLLEAAVRAVRPPQDVDVEIAIHSRAPAGASTGTSASAVVALLAALHQVAGSRRSPYDLAYEAHAIETTALGGESGIQDQLCAAFGGVNFIEIVDYPRAVVTPLALARDVRRELEARLALVYLGRAHSSSDVHRLVLRDLERTGPSDRRLESLRLAALDARDAIVAGDLPALGRAMRRNTDAQASLHSELLCADALRIIEIAAAQGALGWKVNGAGGDGGSLTLLGDGHVDRKTAMLRAIEFELPHCRQIPVALSMTGLRVK